MFLPIIAKLVPRSRRGVIRLVVILLGLMAAGKLAIDAIDDQVSNQPCTPAQGVDQIDSASLDARRLDITFAGTPLTDAARSTPPDITAITQSADGRYLAVATDDGVAVLDAGTSQLLWAQPSPPTGELAFSPDGSILASSTVHPGRFLISQSTVTLWGARTGELLTTLNAASSIIRWSPDGHSIALITGFDNRTDQVTLFDPHSGSPIRVLDPSSRYMDWSPDARTLAIGGANGALELRSAADGSLLASLAAPPVPLMDAKPFRVENAAWSPDGNLIAEVIGYFYSGLRFGEGMPYAEYTAVWDSRTHSLFHLDRIKFLSWSPDSARFAAIDGDPYYGMLTLWDAKTWRQQCAAAPASVVSGDGYWWAIDGRLSVLTGSYYGLVRPSAGLWVRVR